MTGNEPGAAPRRFVIVHGHFYQPPRENPWLEIIERQPSAAPYHDWNECVHDQ
jgi:alpha-amylase/alpha-mannosidase (GH57 family)